MTTKYYHKDRYYAIQYFTLREADKSIRSRYNENVLLLIYKILWGNKLHNIRFAVYNHERLKFKV
jgi:hypothetical protein